MLHCSMSQSRLYFTVSGNIQGCTFPVLGYIQGYISLFKVTFQVVVTFQVIFQAINAILHCPRPNSMLHFTVPGHISCLKHCSRLHSMLYVIVPCIRLHLRLSFTVPGCTSLFTGCTVPGNIQSCTFSVPGYIQGCTFTVLGYIQGYASLNQVTFNVVFHCYWLHSRFYFHCSMLH